MELENILVRFERFWFLELISIVLLLRHGQASLPPEGLEAFWTEDLRKSWGMKLLSSSSPEELNQVRISKWLQRFIVILRAILIPCNSLVSGSHNVRGSTKEGFLVFKL